MTQLDIYLLLFLPSEWKYLPLLFPEKRRQETSLEEDGFRRWDGVCVFEVKGGVWEADSIRAGSVCACDVFDPYLMETPSNVKKKMYICADHSV